MHLVGLSVLSGSHVELVTAVQRELEQRGLHDLPVVVGGIVPPDDAAVLQRQGVAAVFTPKDGNLSDIVVKLVNVVRNTIGMEPAAGI